MSNVIDLHDLAKAAGLGLWVGEQGRITIHDGRMPYPQEVLSIMQSINHETI